MKPYNTYYYQQWGLKNIGQFGGTSGIDIKAEPAWTITKGNANIKVAVIDEGVDLTHPDLQANILQGYDATVNMPGGTNGSSWGNNDHGTHCAGIVGSIDNTIGVVGVASGSKIVPIRIAYDSLYYYGWQWVVKDAWIADGIHWAWNNANADVLSNSWGGGLQSSTIDSAIYNATTQGRGGKGCVVVFAAGNSTGGGPVSYPATLSNVISVGAIYNTGMRATFSNYGNDLDVMAPGALIYTTDLQGSAGSDQNSDYYCCFYGTSAACPFVSGVAALILSIDPNLTWQQVKDIIESTAKKTNYNGAYIYSNTPGHPNGTWNNQMGYGLVNAHEAVFRAWLYGKSITGPSLLPACETATFSFTTPLLPTDYTLHWHVSNDLVIRSGQYTNSIEVQKMPVSAVTNGDQVCIDIMKSGVVVHTICKDINITMPAVVTVGGTNLSTEDFTVTSNTTWSGQKILGVKVIVDPNATLTITGTVYCTDNAQITVYPSGKLVINGGTLTAACPDDMWKGIVVLGNPNQPQEEQYQGKVTLSNNAVIEHALCAISAAPTSYGNAGGGIITATNATFRNNRQAIEYRPYENKNSSGAIIDNVGKFTKCTFIIDPYNRFDANGTFFNYHVTMWEVRGVTCEGCTFNNTTYDGGGACLYTMDAGFKVINSCEPASYSPGLVDCACPASHINTPTTFQNHAYGVFASSTGNPRSIYIDQSEFQNLMYALRISNHDNYRLTRCTITGIKSRGLYSLNSSGYRIEENKFFGSNNFQEIHGINISNSGYVENRIYKNDFTNINKGIYVSGINGPPYNSGGVHKIAGLQFVCNNFTNNTYDVYIESSGTVRSSQGSLSSSAGNTFGNTQISSIYSLSSQTINYYSFYMSTAFIPHNPTSNIILISTTAANSCTSTFCLPDGGGGGGENPTKSTDSLEQYKSMQQQYDELLAHLKDNPELLQELLVLSDAMRELSDHAISRILGDSILYLENLKPWYEVVRTPVAKYSLAEVYFYERKYDQAEMVLNKIPDMFDYSELEMTEHNNYMKFYNFKKQLQLADRNWTQLDETEIAYLQTIAEATNGRSASMAQGVLCFFFNICYEEKIEEGGDGILPPKNMATETQPSDIQIQDLNYELTLYPNPTSSEMTVALNTPAVKIVAMELYDLFGKKVYQQTVNQSYGTLKMTELAQGVYILKVWLDQGDVVIRKVVRQ